MTNATTTPAKSPRHIQSVTIGMRVLTVVESSELPVSLTEISAATGLPSGQAHLYLTSLKLAGLVVQDPGNSRYSLGPYALQLGLTALRKLDLSEAAKDPLARCRDETGETVYIAVWANNGATIVSRLDGRRPLPMTVKVGYSLPLLTSATGRVFLAYLPASVTDPIVAAEEKQLRRDTVSAGEISEARAAVAQVLATGAAETQSLRHFTGFSALAMPIFDGERQLQAAVTLVGPKGLVEIGEDSAARESLKRCASEISTNLGFRRNL